MLMLRRMLTMEHDRIDFDELEGITASWQGRRRRRRRERGREGERERGREGERERGREGERERGREGGTVGVRDLID